jgi:hypothetical protein
VKSYGGAHQVVVRYNTIDGPFNGVGGYNEGYDRYAAYGNDIHDNLFRRIADDTFEPEQNTINWRMWNNRLEDVVVVLSTGPVNYGPLYLFRNEAWRIGNHGSGRDFDGHPGASSQVHKYARNGKPNSRIFWVHNTFRAHDQSVWDVNGTSNAAGGSGSPESAYFANNVWGTTRYVFDYSQAVPGYFEDYNHFATSDTSRGHRYLSTYKDAAAYTSRRGFGAHTNVANPSFLDLGFLDAQLANVAAGDLSLRAGSAFVDAGMPVPNISDRPGVDFVGAGPDLGAWEGQWRPRLHSSLALPNQVTA